MSPFTETASDVLLSLPAEPRAARQARVALHRAQLPEDLQHTVDLLATELIANSVRHGELEPDQQITFFASFLGDFIRVEVHDPGPGFDRERAMEGKGFGLRMVEKLSSRWGIDSSDGCRVWFEVDRRTRRFGRL